MNILFWTHALGNGGAERMVSRLSEAMAEQGHDIYVAAISENNLTYEWDKKVHVLFAGGNKKKRTERRIYSIGYLHRLLKKRHIDVIACFIVNTIPFALLGCLGLKGKQRPKIIGMERANPKARGRLQNCILFPFFQCCDGFVFQTRGAQECFPLSIQRKSTVIGNIAPVGKECGENLEPIPHSICSVGRLHFEKDYDPVFHAFKRVLEAVPDAALYIYGDGPDKDRLVKLAVSLGIGQSVFFEGFSSNVMRDIKKHDVFLFSSKAEGMPNALVEAMAVGMACVSTDCEFGPSELIENGVNGYLVEVGNSDSMAAKVITLLEKPEERKRIGRAAAHIIDQYSEQRIARAYEEYFSKVSGCR